MGTIEEKVGDNILLLPEGWNYKTDEEKKETQKKVKENNCKLYIVRNKILRTLTEGIHH